MAAVGAGALVPSFALSAQFTWSHAGINTSWTNGNNWLSGGGSGTAPISDATNNIFFGVNGTGAVLNSGSGGRALNTINFNIGNDFDLSGTGTITIASGINATTPDANPRTYTISLAAGTMSANNVWHVGGNTTLNFSGIVADSSNAQGINKTGDGVLVMNAENSFAGVLAISAGTLQTSNLDIGGSNSGVGNAASTASNIVIDGGTLRYTGATVSWSRLFTVGANGATIEASGTGTLAVDAGSSDLAMSGTGNRALTLTGSNTGSNTFETDIADAAGADTTGLTKSGTGRWIITDASGSHTYQGVTTINAGTLEVGDTDALPTSTGVVINGGTFLLSGNNQTIGSLEGVGSVNLGSASLTVGNANSTTYSGVISGSGGDVVKVGAGVLTLSGLNSQTGHFVINGGTVEVETLADGGSASGIGAGNSNAGSLILRARSIITWSNEPSRR